MPEEDILSKSDAARLIRRIDWHVLPMLFIVYVVAFLDRSVVLCSTASSAMVSNMVA
jgi:hypothetical protein